MTEFTPREHDILFFLLSREEPVQIQEIAETLETSERTIQRERDRLAQSLEDHDLRLTYVRGRGLLIEGTDEAKHALRDQLLLSHKQLPNAEDRQVELAYRLLQEDGMVKLQAIAHAMYVAPSTVSQDLERIDEWFLQYDLEIKRKKGIGAEVIGEEINKRRLLISLIFTQWDVLAFYRLLQGDAGQLPHLLQMNRTSWLEMINQAYAVIAPLTKEGRLNDRQIMRATLSLALQALRKDQFPMRYELKAYPVEILKWVERVEERLPDTLSIAERQWLSEELRAFFQSDAGDTEELVTRLRVKRLIEHVSLLYGTNFTKDHALERGLVSHIQSYTRQNSVNPSYVIKQIEREYPRLFDAVKQAALSIFTDETFEDVDLAFWVMHFGAVLSKPTPKLPYRVLVVCSAGLGSSKLLMNRLRQEFTELEHIDNSSLFGIERLPIESYDFVLSTVPLPDIRPPHLLVNPLLPQDEVERIRKLILALPKSFQPEPRQTKTEWLDLEQLHRLVASSIQVSNGFQMERLERVDDGIESLLFEISTRIVDQGLAKSAVSLSAQLLRRHEMSGLGVPGTRLALFHGRDATIQRGGFLIFELPEPIDLLGMDQQLQSVERLLVLVAPEETSNELLELLSSISAAIIESPEQMDQFEFGEEHAIRLLLNRTFRTVIDQFLGNT